MTAPIRETASTSAPKQLTAAAIGHDAGSVASRRVRSGAEASGGAAGRESWLRIERRTAAGGWEAALDSGTLAEAFEVRLVDGTRLHSAAAAPPRVQEAGGWHTVLRLTVLHRDPAGHVRLRSELRLHVYREQPFIKLDHRLLVVCANPAAAQYVAGETDERETLLPVRCCVLHLPWEHARHVSRDGERHAVAAGRPWRLRHEHDLEHHAGSPGAELRPGRAAGHVVIHGATELLALGVRHFWQTCPKGIRVEADGIAVEVLPPLSGAELPGDADAWHRLYRWLDGKRYLLREGLALTTEILVAFPAAAAAAEPLFQWLETPPAVRPRLDYANGTGALPRLAAKQGSALPDYETLAGAALHRLQEDREASRAYGHLNFGDWYGEGDWCWGNNEYDTPYGAYWEFLRGGDPAWATWGAEAARHLADVDTVNCFSDPGCVGLQPMHMPAHLGGYLPPLFRSKVDGTRGIPSHTWMEGALLHYLLTGDEGVRESLSRTGDWLLRPERLDHYEFSAVREAGWHLIHLSTLAAATGDPRALDGAAIVVRRILEKQDAGGAWTRMLTSGHCWCGYPHCSGNIAFMVTVLLSGMKRYYDLTGDPAVAASIIAGARWLLRETLDPETGHFHRRKLQHHATAEPGRRRQHPDRDRRHRRRLRPVRRRRVGALPAACATGPQPVPRPGRPPRPGETPVPADALRADRARGTGKPPARTPFLASRRPRCNPPIKSPCAWMSKCRCATGWPCPPTSTCRAPPAPSPRF